MERRGYQTRERKTDQGECGQSRRVPAQGPNENNEFKLTAETHELLRAFQVVMIHIKMSIMMNNNTHIICFCLV